MRYFGCIFRAALRTRHLLLAEQCAARTCSLRRRDAVLPKLAVAILRLLKGILEGAKEPRRALPDLYLSHGLAERAT